MDVFSLEEDDGQELFITQEVKENKSDNQLNEDSDGIFGFEDMCFDGEMEGQVACDPQFSDISDEDFEANKAVLKCAKR